MSDNLAIHIRHVHEKIKEHKCSFCSFESTRKSKLVEHLSSVHNTVIQIVDNINVVGGGGGGEAAAVAGCGGIQIPIEGIELQIFDKADALS